MSPKYQQSILFKGIYEFEDPSGVLVAAKVPPAGTADLYSGTKIIVKANQSALFIYKGKIAEALPEGTHSVKTENFPILTRLANWQFGFESPLQAEIWFFSNAVFAGRRWGTTQPVIYDFPEYPAVPIRAYGIYNIVVRDSKKVFMTLVGNRASYDISELDNLIQAQITELLPKTLSVVPNLESLNKSQAAVSKELFTIVNKALEQYGVELLSLQVIAMVPAQEVIQALGDKVAMNIIGDKREYLLYKAANSLLETHPKGDKGSSDTMQLMMGLMLGQSLLDHRERERPFIASVNTPKDALPDKSQTCPKCNAMVGAGDKFCSSCGAKLL
jgi:membrane protease subunit (stomatin/prohibitin family)